ncbi:PREDICTED: ubiquitin-like-specific protease 1 [Acropora digitifera]|uniref:ubiquitin-like-specific protease 1 n=1 Tax=Acropora digitifera TaxID=70779 RepID=UPI00077AB43E|nr:PREDICTED: ubiquitin-like-specific protease 1 [Acropora digitifera]
MDLILFWKSKTAELPELYKIASTYCTATITSCDVERSFSSYNEILDEKRRSLDPTTMKVFHFLNWNIRVKSSLEKEQEEQHSKKTASKPPSVFITTSPTSSPKATSQQGNVFTKTESKLKSFSNTTSTRNNASSSKETLSKTANVFTKLVSKPLGVSYTISSKPESNSMPSFSKPTNESKSPRFSSTTSSPKPTSSTKESFSKQGNFFNKTVSKLPTASNPIQPSHQSRQTSLQQPRTNSSSTFTAILSEPPGASKTASTESANIIVTNKRKAESSDVSYKQKKQIEKRVSFRIHYGLQNLAPTLNTEASCNFPECNRPLRSCLLNGTVKFQGDTVIDGGDIIGLLGGNSADEENYLSNFVVDSYLKLISMESSMKGLSTVSLKWERFEKNVGKECARCVLKRKDGKASFLEHDLILTPCNEPGSKHWFLLVTKPKEKQMLVLDSLAGSFIKPSTARAMDKMWSVVKELDEDVNEWEWSFHINKPCDIPQQQNGFDCGVFVCAYARNLALQSPVPCQTSVPSFRSVMLLELHNKAMYGFTEASPQVGLYYAVEYGKSYYIGRALGSPSGDSCRTTGLSLRAGGRGFSPAATSLSPGYFDTKRKY